MADKRISQLVDRGTVANNDVVPIVVSGATTTNKATISSIQTFMQGNLDLGVTSVGVTLGSSGTDVNVTGSPITSSGNITINFPTASATNRGLLSAADWVTFNSKQDAGSFVTLNTTQTITAQKTFTTSGSSDTMIISHGSGSGFALDVLKAGNGEAIRVTKSSGSGNAMTISGGNFEAGTIVKTGGTSSQFLKADGSIDSSTYYLASNPSGFTTNVGTVTSVGGTGTVSGLTLSGTVTSSGNLTLGGTLSLTSNNVTTALGFTPYNATNPSGFTSNVGTVTSVAASAGTGISISGSPITSSGTLNITNTAPDQVVSLTASTGISVSGSYPNFTITNTSPASAGITGSGTSGRIPIFTGANTIANSNINAASSTIYNENPVAGQFAWSFLGNSTTGQSYGALVAAGTNASDTSFEVRNQSGLNTLFKVRGDGNVGIGTATPFTATNQTRLTINGSVASGTNLFVNNVNTAFYAASTGGLFVGSVTDIPVIFSTNDTERMRITSGGNVGIGTATPSDLLSCQLPSGQNGEIIRIARSAGAYAWSIGIDSALSNLNFYNNGRTSVANINNATGVYVATSDQRLKENIEYSGNAIDKLLAIKVRKYDWKDSEIKEDFGFVAQELFEVLPQYVSEGNEENYWGVAKAELVPFLVKAIQELKTEIDSLKNQIQ